MSATHLDIPRAPICGCRRVSRPRPVAAVRSPLQAEGRLDSEGSRHPHPLVCLRNPLRSERHVEESIGRVGLAVVRHVTTGVLATTNPINTKQPGAHRYRRAAAPREPHNQPAGPPASRAAGLPSPPGGSLPHVLPRAGLIDINGHDSPHSPTQRTTLIPRSNRARWPTGLARHSKPKRPAEIAPDVESDVQM